MSLQTLERTSIDTMKLERIEYLGGDLLVVAIDGRIENKNAEELNEFLLSAISETEKCLLIDLDKVPFMHATAISVLLGILKLAKSSDKRLLLCDLSDSIKKLFLLTRMVDIFDISRSRKDTIKEESDRA